MADYTIASSVNIEKGKQNEEYCVEQVISFQQQTNMEKVFNEVVYPEESTLKKMDHVAVSGVTVSLLWQNSSPNVSTRLRRAYPSDVVHEFDPQLKFVTFTVHRDPEDEDVNNNKYTSTTATKSAFQNPCNKVPVNKFSEEAPVYRWVFLLGFCNEIV